MKKVRVEFHVHTKFASACSCLDFETILGKAKKNKIDYTVITDHNQISGALAFRKFLKKKGEKLEVIIGEEIATREGEVIGFFLKERIREDQSVTKTCQEILNQGGLIAIPHPFDTLRHKALGADSKKIIKFSPLVEIFNARIIFSKENKKAEKFCQENNLPSLVGSDAHMPSELSKTFIEMDNFKGAADFLEKLKNASFVTKKNSFPNIFTSLLVKKVRSFFKLKKN